MEQRKLVQIRDVLVNRFSAEELRDLCFVLGVNFDSLEGNGHAAKARELVIYFNNRHRIPGLMREIEKMRPDISFDEQPFAQEIDTVWLTTLEAMDETGFGSSFLYRLARDGRVRARKEGGKWLFDRDVLLAHIHGWIGTEEASDLTDYTIEHIRWLAREGIVWSKKIRGFWLLEKESLLTYSRLRGKAGN